ncbi:hypothetical protein [Chitinophaga silvisoli]|nr:hypothetical protein [Chitinophaga silvisoli]
MKFYIKVITMSSKEKEIREFSEKMLKGTALALKKLVEARAANNETMIVSDNNGKFKKVPARELLDIVRKQS